MKLLVDMNLSPSWVERLAGHGFGAVHWSTIGTPTTPDVEILAWSPEGDLSLQIALVAGARNPLNLEFSWSAA